MVMMVMMIMMIVMMMARLFIMMMMATFMLSLWQVVIIVRLPVMGVVLHCLSVFEQGILRSGGWMSLLWRIDCNSLGMLSRWRWIWIWIMYWRHILTLSSGARCMSWSIGCVGWFVNIRSMRYVWASHCMTVSSPLRIVLLITRNSRLTDLTWPISLLHLLLYGCFLHHTTNSFLIFFVLECMIFKLLVKLIISCFGWHLATSSYLIILASLVIIVKMIVCLTYLCESLFGFFICWFISRMVL